MTGEEEELAEVQPDLEIPLVPEFLHYTDEKGWRGIDSSGVIRSRQKRVYATMERLNPQTVELALFAGNPAYSGRGQFVIIFTVREGIIFHPGTQPNELDHFGSLRNGRHIDIVYSGTNHFA